MTYVPEVPAGWFDDVILPDYYLANASIFYDYKNWSVTLNVRNVFDETYFTNQVFWDDLLVLPSEPISADIKVSYKF